jgi:hypothetical protein
MTTPESPRPPSPDQPAYEPFQPPPQYGYRSPLAPGQPPAGYGYPGQPMPAVPADAQYAGPQGPIGHMRPTGMTILLFFVTLGIWSFIYYYQTQEEMKRHSGEGIGGVIALVLSIFVGIVSPFILSHEVGQLYSRRGQEPPVTALTALWFFPGALILVGPFVWFVKTNNALNDYWASLGARGTVLV